MINRPHVLLLIKLGTLLHLLSSFVPSPYQEVRPPNDVKADAYDILKSKCNVCHNKQNPFMVFNENNMVRRAEKIYNAVFFTGRMPKGDEYTLSEQEISTLKNWLESQLNQ